MRSATLRPSRAPSTTKSVMSATASGWLSLTPRSSRRRATCAAMATRSLSFSRGVRFIGSSSAVPEPRQARRQARCLLAQAGNIAHHGCVHAGSRPEKAREKEPVHQGGAAAARVACREIARGSLQRCRILAGVKRRRKGIGAIEGRGPRPHGSHVIRKPERIRPDEHAAAADAPRLMKEAAGEALAARNPAEDEGFCREEPRARRDVEDERAPKTRALEQNRFLRQPLEPCAPLDAKAHRDARIGA